MLKPGSKVRKVIDVKGIVCVTESTYTMCEWEGGLHAIEDHHGESPSPYPFNPTTGMELGNPLSRMGITCRVVGRDGVSDGEPPVIDEGT